MVGCSNYLPVFVFVGFVEVGGSNAVGFSFWYQFSGSLEIVSKLSHSVDSESPYPLATQLQLPLFSISLPPTPFSDS